MKKLLIAADHAGYPLKQGLIKRAAEIGVTFEDLGTHSADSVDYPDYANLACNRLSGGDDDIAILICGSGIGISIAANRHAHIRAALCETENTAARARSHNHANVLCLGAQIVSEDLALKMIKTFLSTPTDNGERHLRRIKKLCGIGAKK
ncbi:MAG: ribose 5-phosphate isomerase B [Bdellovibrionales bacterium]|nr:ribose 5-phosphate isomerase B [Bdellovibrionales bacterium]